MMAVNVTRHEDVEVDIPDILEILDTYLKLDGVFINDDGECVRAEWDDIHECFDKTDTKSFDRKLFDSANYVKNVLILTTEKKFRKMVESREEQYRQIKEELGGVYEDRS